ncbi:hypothetical protein T492DRAFT_845706 [Pavlovales sp. CCMP2436]|nr:hypothetical protein T492DRAFT_845706 [Pavlovales sp. CCMP2436]
MATAPPMPAALRHRQRQLQGLEASGISYTGGLWEARVAPIAPSTDEQGEAGRGGETLPLSRRRCSQEEEGQLLVALQLLPLSLLVMLVELRRGRRRRGGRHDVPATWTPLALPVNVILRDLLFDGRLAVRVEKRPRSALQLEERPD